MAIPRPQSRPEAALVGRAHQVLSAAIDALVRTRDALGPELVSACQCILEARGRVVVTGLGKSGIVAKKIAATLASTGTPALFVHAAEAVHGDLGMLAPGDVLLALSNSGETEEVIDLLPTVKVFGCPVVAMVVCDDSTLARQADIVLRVAVTDEGCPIGLAPMSSTTAMMSLGDALAATLMEMRGFRREDFAVFHPRGSLGRRLLTRVTDLMQTGDRLPLVGPTSRLGEVLGVMISSNLGLAVAVDCEGRLMGVLSDGDIKRLLQRPGDLFEKTMEEVMTRDPITTTPPTLAESALRRMEEDPRRLITVMPVVDDERRVVGLVRMHDILAAKIR